MREQALSTDGRCRRSTIANGYARGEGVSGMALVLKAIHVASAAESWLYCWSVIRRDGVVTSLTAPNGSAQVGWWSFAVVNAVCARESYAHVEAHGTGTPLGDPTGLAHLSRHSVAAPYADHTEDHHVPRRHQAVLVALNPPLVCSGLQFSSRRLRDARRLQVLNCAC